jgi:protein phosphatase
MDLGSLNGTRLNGQAVGKPGRQCGAWHPLAAGDVIHFGERDESPAIAVSLLPPPAGGAAGLTQQGCGSSRTSSSNLSCAAAAAGRVDTAGVSATRRLAAVSTSSSDSAGSSLALALPPPYSALLPPPQGALAVPVAVRQDAARGRPCEDRSLVEMPLRGHPDVALFCVFDGHCGGGAAQQASDLLPGCLALELSNLPPGWRASPDGAGPALRAAFLATDAAMRCEYEGCAATAVLTWRDGDGAGAPAGKGAHRSRLFVQAANVGDCTAVLGAPGARWLGDDETEEFRRAQSSPPAPQSPATGPASPLAGALMSSSGHTALVLTQDHKVATPHERERLRAAQVALRPTENRLYGLALARVLGDHFLKTDVSCGLIADPFVSRVAVVDTSRGSAFAVTASDGLWDVTTPAAAVQMAAVAGAGGPGGGAGCDAAAAALLAHARQKRSKDDCTVLCVALS